MVQVFKSFAQSLNQVFRMPSDLLKVEHLSIFLLWLFTISSLIGIGFGHVEWFITKTPINLLLGFLLVLINTPFTGKYSKYVFVFAFLFGMVLEIVGVVRGDIFGEYFYGDNLGFKVFDVPLMIGIYWAVLTVATSQIARMFFDKILLVAFAGASLMVGLDFLMEQMAHIFDFWHFEGGVAPAQNYFAWFIAAYFLHILAFKFIPKGGSRFASHLYLNQAIFFIVTYILIQQ